MRVAPRNRPTEGNRTMSQRMDYNAASPAGAKALGVVYGHVRQSGFPVRLIDLVYPRVPDQRMRLLHRHAFAGPSQERDPSNTSSSSPPGAKPAESSTNRKWQRSPGR